MQVHVTNIPALWAYLLSPFMILSAFWSNRAWLIRDSGERNLKNPTKQQNTSTYSSYQHHLGHCRLVRGIHTSP